MKNAGVWIGAFVLLIAAVIFWQSFSLEYYRPTGPGPGLFPRWLSGMLIVVSIVYIGISIRKEPVHFKDILPMDKGALNLVLIVVSYIVFMLIAPFAGFTIAGTVMLMILFWQSFRWYQALPLSFGISVLLLIIFQVLLDVPLPINAWGW